MEANQRAYSDESLSKKRSLLSILNVGYCPCKRRCYVLVYDLLHEV